MKQMFLRCDKVSHICFMRAPFRECFGSRTSL